MKTQEFIFSLNSFDFKSLSYSDLSKVRSALKIVSHKVDTLYRARKQLKTIPPKRNN